jgi:hypothetical protein
VSKYGRRCAARSSTTADEVNTVGRGAIELVAINVAIDSEYMQLSSRY